MAQDVKPTRTELMKLKKKIKLAKSGYNLLKKKRDGLILSFFEILKQAKTVRQELTEEYKKGVENMNKARILESDLKLKSIALAIHEMPQVNVSSKNIMGVVVPKLEYKEHLQKHFLERGYGLSSSSSAIDEAAFAYEKVIEKVLLASEVETSMKKLLVEIEKTKRRVNALEFVLIPQMEETRKFITLRLEEMEREGTFRLKRIKVKA